MKLFKIGKNVRIKILIWHMAGEMIKKWGRFYLSCNYSCSLHLLVKIKEVKLNNLHTLACLNLRYGTTKHKTKIKRLQRCWDSSEPVASLILVIFSAS